MLPLASDQSLTCQIRYTLDLNQLAAFETYARTWMMLIPRYGGVHHGYFIPRSNPDTNGASFPELGYDGPTNIAVALFSFPDVEAYLKYREIVATDPQRQAMAQLVRETRCFTRYERLFLQPITSQGQPVNVG